ncbi:MAG: AMP-binding protein, partial [Alphaproteobacteria bacterium]|nr:AMP-binding protein [Alphaproteobacteria bacterium]
IVFTTSGTTRAPKLVLHGQTGIAVHAAEVVRAFGYDAADTVVLQAIPLCGVFGFCQAMATLAAGRPLILMPAFDADEAVALCRQFTVTNFEATDGMVDAMLCAAPDDAPFQPVRRVGFAAFDRELEDLPARAGARGIPMVGLWGMSEMQALVASRPPDAAVADRSRAGGRLVSPQAAARVRDPDSGELLPPGQPGALEIAGPSRMLGYFGNPEATAETLTEDGFVRTGDLAVLEPDGGFEFLARMGDSLRLGGFLVNPAEIESEIEAQPGVAAAQVIEVAMDGRNRPFAFVTVSAGEILDEAAVRAACADRMAAYKRPVRVVALDAFPVTESANGTKIQRTRLREMAQAMVDRTGE